MDAIRLGLIGECSEVVTEQLTADALGSGSIAVYGTPAMIALMEKAAVAALDHLLTDGLISVGIAIDIKHLNATPLGQCVTARAEIIDVDDRRIRFTLTAWDETEAIGEGNHTRAIVDQDRFTRRWQHKTAKQNTK